MKIIHVREIANVAATLVSGLQRLGHEAELEPMRTRRSEGALELTGVPSRILEASRINGYIRRNRFDVVHIHWAYMGWMGILGRYPYFLHCHGFDLARNLRWPALGWLTRVSLRRARRVFYSTPDLKAFADPVRPDAVFIPNPINVGHFRPAPSANGREPRLLMISRFEAKKGPETAVAIVRALREHNSDVRVDAFDWGVMKARFEDAGLNFIPRVPYSEMPDLLNSYDAIIGQFQLGILSMSELEAMACGRPVVSFFDYPDVYDEPPPVFSVREPAEGAATLARLLDDAALRKDAGQRGRAWVEKHHEFVNVARMIEGHYKQALEG